MRDELEGGEVPQGLVGTYGIVGTFPGQELLVQGGHLEGELHDFIELLRMGTLCPLYTPVELGGPWGKSKEPDVPLLASLFKTCLELGAAVHLDGLYGEWHPLQEESSSETGMGAW